MANLEILNQRDGLTGYHTKQGLFEYLRSQTQSVYSRVSPMTLIIFDLDKFKNINDKHGHLVGDDALRYFSMILNKALKGQGFVARYGGDEFVAVINDDRKGKGGVEVAKRFQLLLRKEKFHTPKGRVRVRSSIGLAAYPGDAQSPRELIDKADQALYYAKEHGRGRIISCQSLKGRSIKDKAIYFLKIAVVAFLVLVTIVAYQETGSMRGVADYYRNISNCTQYFVHKSKHKYNFSSVTLKNGDEITGWVIKKTSHYILLSKKNPVDFINPFKSRATIQPIKIPLGDIEAAVNANR